MYFSNKVIKAQLKEHSVSCGILLQNKYHKNVTAHAQTKYHTWLFLFVLL